MHFKIFVRIFILSILIISCKDQYFEEEIVSILPNPDTIETSEDYFVLNSDTGINSNSQFSISTDFLK